MGNTGCEVADELGSGLCSHSTGHAERSVHTGIVGEGREDVPEHMELGSWKPLIDLLLGPVCP